MSPDTARLCPCWMRTRALFATAPARAPALALALALAGASELRGFVTRCRREGYEMRGRWPVMSCLVSRRSGKKAVSGMVSRGPRLRRLSRRGRAPSPPAPRSPPSVPRRSVRRLRPTFRDGDGDVPASPRAGELDGPPREPALDGEPTPGPDGGHGSVGGVYSALGPGSREVGPTRESRRSEASAPPRVGGVFAWVGGVGWGGVPAGSCTHDGRRAWIGTATAGYEGLGPWLAERAGEAWHWSAGMMATDVLGAARWWYGR